MSLHLGEREPGVYEFVRDGFSVVAQLDIDGNWWPFPYSFSGWRESELETFDTVHIRRDLEADAPNASVESKLRHAMHEARTAYAYASLKAHKKLKKYQRAKKAYSKHF